MKLSCSFSSHIFFQYLYLNRNLPVEQDDMVVEGVTPMCEMSSSGVMPSGCYPSEMDLCQQYDREQVADAMLKLSTFSPLNGPESRVPEQQEFVPQNSQVGSQSDSQLPNWGPNVMDEMRPRSMSMGTTMSRSPISLYNDNSCSDDGRSRSNSISLKDRAKRDFVPDNKKDQHYWTKRRKNNEAAKRSREKRRLLDQATSQKVEELTLFNDKLQRELKEMKSYYGYPLDQPFSPPDTNTPITNTKDLTNSKYLPALKPILPAIPFANVLQTMLKQQQHQEAAIAAALAQCKYSVNTTAPSANHMDVKPLAVLPDNYHRPSENGLSITPAVSDNKATTSTTAMPKPSMIEIAPQTTSGMMPFLYNGGSYFPGKFSAEHHSTVKHEDYHSDHKEDQKFNLSPVKKRKLSGENSADLSSHDPSEYDVVNVKTEDGTNETHTSFNNNSGISNKPSAGNVDNYTSVSAAAGGLQPDSSSKTSQSTYSQHSHSQKGIPFKLRHKHMNLDQITNTSSTVVTTSEMEKETPRGSPQASEVNHVRDTSPGPEVNLCRASPTSEVNLSRMSPLSELHLSRSSPVSEVNAREISPEPEVRLPHSFEPLQMNLPPDNPSLPGVPLVIDDIDTSTDDDSSGFGDTDQYQKFSQDINRSTSYTERRRKNNLAARKCRENKKKQLRIKEAQSDQLESENRNLKDKVKRITSEVQSLRELISKKKSAEKQGRSFTLPPLEILEKMLSEKLIQH